MKTELRKLILPFPSLHQLQGNLTCRVWTTSSKLKVHFCKHCFPQPLSDCCAFPHSPSGAKTISGKVILKKIRLLWVWHTSGLTVGSGQPVYRQKMCLEVDSIGDETQDPYRSNVQNSTTNFLPSKVLSNSLLDLSAFIFTVFRFILCSYTEVIPFIKLEKPFNKQISCRNQWIICGKSVQWSEGTQLLTVFALFQTLKPSPFWGMGVREKKKKKRHIFVPESL